MSRRLITISVDCGPEHCGACHGLSPEDDGNAGAGMRYVCDVFPTPSVFLALDGGKPLRCPACLEAEVRSRHNPGEVVQLLTDTRGPLLRLTCEGDGDLHHYPERCKRPNCADPNCREWGNVQILTGEHAGHWMHHVSECEMVTPDAEALKALTEGLFMASAIRRHGLTVTPTATGWLVYTLDGLRPGLPHVLHTGPDLAALVAEVAHECEAALEAARGDKEAHDDAEDHGAGCGC